MDQKNDTDNKLKYIMIHSVLYNEMDRVREYASDDGELFLPNEVLECLFRKSQKDMPLKQGISLVSLCSFFDGELIDILNGEKSLGFSLKDFRTLVDLNNCPKIPNDTPNRANISIIQGDLSIFVEEKFYLIMSILLYMKARFYRNYFNTVIPRFESSIFEKIYINNGNTFCSIYSMQSILSIMNFLDCFISVLISDKSLEQLIDDNVKKMKKLFKAPQYESTTKHNAMKKGFLLLNNFDLSDFDNKWVGFKSKYKSLDDGILIRHNITHFESNTDKSFIYSNSNEWLVRAEIMIKDVCNYSIDLWQSIHGHDSLPEYLSKLSFDKLTETCQNNVYKELEYSIEVHEFMKKRFNY